MYFTKYLKNGREIAESRRGNFERFLNFLQEILFRCFVKHYKSREMQLQI